ncbi:sensor histidine kinase [Pedobacter caeni]|uniref:Histidine kinase n=1 Tax=Pedobacter caeni TaxID=288992 RepID=A0A1M5KXL5_9SPHI|nr:histidine kinase [Pedobacter caeni]SHG57465.1 Histidine kinase [Pedobacter caeni]
MNLVAFILFFVACVQNVYGQQVQTGKSYLRFEAAELPGSEIREIGQGKQIKVYTSGGFIRVHTTAAFDELSHRLSEKGLTKETKIREGGFEAYVSPNKEFSIDVLDRKTDTILRSYVIKRPNLIPEIKFYHQAKNSEGPFYISSSGDDTDEFSTSAGEIKLGISERTDFKNMEVEYALVNLKTRRSQRGLSKTDLPSLKLIANTDYELRVNYVVQKESQHRIYIHVKPYLYQSTITYMILLAIVVALGFLVVTRGLRKKIKSSEKEQQKMEEAAIRLQSLLNPHFTFNALSSIQGLMNTGRIEEANEYLQEFSSLLRKTLAKSRQVFNSLDQELEMMRMYIHLEALRFNFSWDIELSETLHTSDIEIPTLLLQPLIENAIKHGLSGLGDKGRLLIICREGEKKNTFVIVVKDNGTWLEKIPDSGYGLSLTAERILTINKLKEEQAIVLDFNKQSGTEAILTFHN